MVVTNQGSYVRHVRHIYCPHHNIKISYTQQYLVGSNAEKKLEADHRLESGLDATILTAIEFILA